MTPRLLSWFTPLQALALVVNPKLGLRQWKLGVMNGLAFLRICPKIQSGSFAQLQSLHQI